MASQFSQEDSDEPSENLRRSGAAASSLESSVKVCASKILSLQTKYLPFSGTVRTDKLPFLPYLAALDVRHRLGSYDEMVDRNGSRVRLCNWVRFVNYKEKLDNQVNLVASRSRGSVLFEVVKEIAEGEELVVFLLPDSSSEDPFSMSALAILRSSIYRRTLDSIISEAPLDLSRSLLSSTAPPPEQKMTVDAAFSAVRKRQDPDIHDGDISSSPKRRCLSQSSPSSFLSSVFQSNNVLPGYFPFSFPPRPMFHPSAFPLPKLQSAARDNLHPSIKSIIPHKDNLSLPGTSPSRPHSSPVRISVTPKRRERTMLPCSVCGKAFDRPSLLKRHMRTHTGEKPHVCDVCEKGFSTSSSLNTHRRIHSGEKPHQCGVCGKRFTASSNLYYHKMTHVKEKPHKCTLCTRSFPTPGDLRSHMFVHNGQWPHKCTVCGKGFSKLTNLRNHTLLHSGDRQPKRISSPTSYAIGTTSESFHGTSSLTPSPPPSSSFITSTPSRPATPLRTTSPYSSASSTSSPPPPPHETTPSESILSTKASKNVLQASKRFLSVSFLARSASRVDSPPPRPTSPVLEDEFYQSSRDFTAADNMKIHTERERAARVQEESSHERDLSFEDHELSLEDHKQFQSDRELSPSFSSDFSPIRNSSPSTTAKLLHNSSVDHSNSRSSSPLSMSVPLQLSLPTQLFTSTAYSPLFSLASSYLASSLTTPTSTIFTLPPSVVPSILPLLTQNNPFSTSTSLPSPPLSPTPEKESLRERERLKDFIHKHSLTKTDKDSEDDDKDPSGSSKTGSPSLNQISFLAALAQSQATSSDTERITAYSNFKKAEELFLSFQNGDLKFPPMKEKEYECKKKDKNKPGRSCGLELVGEISESNAASNSKIESLNEL